MQKVIRILAIIAAALGALSTVLLLLSMPFQQLLTEHLYGLSGETLDMLPQFPLIPFIFTMLRTGLMAILIICCGNQKGGIWLEIVICGVLLLVLPALYALAHTLYTTLVINMRGYAFATAQNVVYTLADRCMTPAGWGQALAYLTCGMSIAFKLHRPCQTP